MSTTSLPTIDTHNSSGYLQRMSYTEEQKLLKRVLNGDHSCFELIVKEHTGKVVGLAWRLLGNQHEAEDIAQEAFLRLYKALPKFKGESRISTWLYRTTTRLAIDHLRRAKLKRKIFFFRQDDKAPDPVDHASDGRANPSKELISNEAMQSLRRSLSKLSARQQVIFTLRHYEGFSLNEIAEQLGIETGTVKAHLHRAVTQLRIDLKEYHEEMSS